MSLGNEIHIHSQPQPFADPVYCAAFTFGGAIRPTGAGRRMSRHMFLGRLSRSAATSALPVRGGRRMSPHAFLGRLSRSAATSALPVRGGRRMSPHSFLGRLSRSAATSALRVWANTRISTDPNNPCSSA
jgi:hypothetical protein